MTALPDSTAVAAAREAAEVSLRKTEKMEAVAQLTGGIAHDFNNMLTVILANAELLAGAIGDNPTAHADLEELRTAARRGTAMVRKLLSFSRRERLVLQSLNLGRLAQELTNHLRTLLPENIQLDVTAGTTPEIQADANALEQIVLNLLTNARDAMPQGGRVTVETTIARLDLEYTRHHGASEPGDYVCLTVADTGVGMDERTRARLFEPFFTTKPPGLGTGLGMAMIYGLVQQHGGFVAVESQPRLGTTVRVYLPVNRGGTARPTAIEERPVRGGQETILVVDDEEPIRRTARRILEQYGYRVLVASDGAEGLDVIRARNTEIDLVISDVAMPTLGGRGLYDAARASGAKMKFLFASGYTARDIGATGDIDAALPFIHKPWTLSEFVGRVREVLDHKASER